MNATLPTLRFKSVRNLALLTIALSLIPAPSAPAQCELMKIMPANSAPFDFIGAALDLSDTVAIIGAFGSNFGVPDGGAAYIYRYDGIGWIQEAVLTASDAATDDRFGISVAVQGDLAIVGAYLDDDLGLNSGSAYVFRRNAAGIWNQETKLTAPDGAAADRFGISVSVEGEVLLVGSYFNNAGAVNSGAAYVYRYDPVALTWTTEAKLTAADGAANDNFGVSVDLSGGIALVGAYRNDTPIMNAGAGYVFRYDAVTGGWNQESKLIAADGAADDRFGFSVALSGSVAVLGSYLNDNSGVDAGAAYVFRFDPGLAGWNQEAKLTAADGAAGDNFGVNVDVSDDLVIVGAFLHDSPATDAGAAYLYHFNAGWTQQTKLTASDTSPFDRYGIAVAASGDTAMVGAYFNDQAGVDTGAPYVYGGTTGADCNNNGQLDACEIASGLLLDANANLIPDVCEPPPTPPCPADCAPQNPDGTWGDGTINIIDLITLINNYQTADVACDFAPLNPDGTAGGDGIVSIFDLIGLINAYGPCPQ